MAKILIVDAIAHSAQITRNRLEKMRHTVEHASNSDDALLWLRTYHFDLLVINWTYTGIQGDILCLKARALGLRLPIFLLSTLTDTEDIVRGLDSGADDLISGPVHEREFLARVRALLRRGYFEPIEELRFEDIKLIPKSQLAYCGRTRLKLMPREFQILEYLMRSENIAVSPASIARRVWGADHDISPLTIRSLIRGLRQKLAAAGSKSAAIVTVNGTGYKLEALPQAFSTSFDTVSMPGA